ncbi:MAG: hypothetical protein AUG02_01450 [Chloroflexi bacterium 13_1_20CM_2_70_9]|nr:MAG: hypothetical protein AUG02_01450 [Chloroflexi bacterium 13_1_20CM_2_70_9]
MRNPQRVRNSASWRAITITMTLIAIGPWSTNIAKTGPTSGTPAIVPERWNGVKMPAPPRPDGVMIRRLR